MWRRLVARAHPDAGGSHDLFIWTGALRELVCGGELGAEIPRRPQSEPPPPPPPPPAAPDRVDFSPAFDKAASFTALTRQAVDLANGGELLRIHAGLLRILTDCHEAPASEPVLHRQQQQGATYKQLARIAHTASMSKPERVKWYRVCESIPLAQRHAGHILSRLQDRAA